MNDQVARIRQLVVPGTPRDLLHIVDGLLNLDGGVKPEMSATDSPRPSGPADGQAPSHLPSYRGKDAQREPLAGPG